MTILRFFVAVPQDCLFARAIELGWLWRHHPYVKFTPAGAELFA
jgi:hypothetical protein